MDRQMDRQTDRSIDRQTDGQTDGFQHMPPTRGKKTTIKVMKIQTTFLQFVQRISTTAMTDKQTNPHFLKWPHELSCRPNYQEKQQESGHVVISQRKTTTKKHTTKLKILCMDYTFATTTDTDQGYLV